MFSLKRREQYNFLQYYYREIAKEAFTFAGSINLIVQMVTHTFILSNAFQKLILSVCLSCPQGAIDIRNCGVIVRENKKDNCNG